MTPETESFLDRVRHAEQPSQEDEQRVLHALQASVAAGVIGSVAVSSWRSNAWLGPGGSALASTIAKLSLLAVGTALGLSVERGPTQAATSSTPTSHSAPPPNGPRVVALPVAVELPPVAPVPSGSALSANVRPGSRRAQREAVPSLRGELQVLDKAQRALRAGDGEAALRELDASMMSDGPLRAERQAARILALCSAGRQAEARAAIARFLEDYPQSAQRAAIVGGCTNSATD